MEPVIFFLVLGLTVWSVAVIVLLIEGFNYCFDETERAVLVGLLSGEEYPTAD